MVFVQKSTFFSCVFFLSQKTLKKTFFDIFSPWFFFKNGCFSNLFFLAKKARKKHFFIFWIVKNAFQPWKVKFQQSPKSRHFAKGLWFLSKNRRFSYMFFFTKKSQKERVFDILDRKECFLDQKRKVLKNSKESTFCKGVSPWFLSQNCSFLICFFSQPKTPERNIF